MWERGGVCFDFCYYFALVCKACAFCKVIMSKKNPLVNRKYRKRSYQSSGYRE